MVSTEQLYQKFLECTGVSTDTRRITPGCLFVALKGDKFDGNQFVEQALASGARYALVDDADVAARESLAGSCLLVADALTALQDLARHHRQTFTFPVIGLTGSNGKTTTKELIAGVLSKKYRTYATVGNLNNHIGVPLTLLAINDQYEMAVVEMGANHQEEIELLCSIAQPTHGLITNVGKAHLEGFGGFEGVKKGKGELYDYLAQQGRTVFINSRDTILTALYRERLKTHRPETTFAEAIFYPGEPVELLQESPVVIYRDADGQEVMTHLPGRYNFENMLAALAIGDYFGVTSEDANRAIADYNPTNNRSQVVTKGTNTILLDAYNANPSSMAAAIRQFAAMPAAHKAVILGDMYELGNESEAEHASLGKLIAEGKFDRVILAGKDIKYALSYLPKAFYFPDKFSLHNWLMDHPMTDTHILVKGSRGMSLESVIPFI
ncbi:MULTISPECIES: UDP-N-acetylmuramoyl-tripeptide--D-alanyl-D-alanine ligase [unclassified Spirosoma]|uniref:UDP-N-acetylmuramoyl-tripeptide--D-alanyl-D- alanine ligase n=1 Tax=unclassified Spirosoma TaxID=2621999 RepID=UPI000962FF50|nr:MULTISPECIES: UDP-N-acetylmuramoyl-tripeptide--D-alanyl-D-alanine ligase [unclassified Spirosoma]MBN8822060.1 UDP-N-acetylmuramoyl-tripeptide--D-alanyl-D-alanine ligase [Spirosoma sp.]OJW80464.1 MAG: UDP-N-acetylmuramoyl-tripeptide--D-alanyl-D-alanine ligase [Spirosoma sp. 48-14]